MTWPQVRFELGWDERGGEDSPEAVERRRERKRHKMFERVCDACAWTPARFAEQPLDVIVDKLAGVCGQNARHIDRGLLPAWVRTFAAESRVGSR